MNMALNARVLYRYNGELQVWAEPSLPALPHVRCAGMIEYLDWACGKHLGLDNRLFEPLYSLWRPETWRPK